MPEPDEFEDDLLYAITRTGEGFRPEQADQVGLVAGGYQRGRRRWRRRSTAAVVGAAAALALVGTGAVYLTGSTSASSGSGTVAAASSGAASSSTALVTPASAASATASPTAAAVSGDEVLATFQALLPKGQVTVGQGTGTEQTPGEPGGAGATLVFDDGKGKAAMDISVGRVASNDPNLAQDACPDKKMVPYEACTTTSLPGGGSVTVFQGYEYPDGRATTKRWNARLIGQDGRQIELSEWNSAAEKGSPDSRPTPPLSPEQLKAIVTDKSWDRIVAAIPEPKPAPVRDTSKEYGSQEILQNVAKLLPSGLTETEPGGDGFGYANFVLDDGKGKSLVQLNLQDWTHDDKTKEQLFGNAQTLPDGTKVVVSKGSDKPGVGMWTVDTLHPDGLRVVISSFNSGTQQAPATRKAPVLTNDQMQAIAAAPVWKLKK
ncbi:hypothetical protein ABZW30_31190 [Kitasatospora sp. NPDC004669]|uniref:hypothetical protein n=1 Tax=Kitasatospora sp. NPDC004669 TaxID=3154555 RepID=UPI0033AEA9EC